MHDFLNDEESKAGVLQPDLSTVVRSFKASSRTTKIVWGKGYFPPLKYWIE